MNLEFLIFYWFFSMKSFTLSEKTSLLLRKASAIAETVWQDWFLKYKEINLGLIFNNSWGASK